MLASRYQIIQQLSQGGFGATHLAKDTLRPGEPLCVVKELHHRHQNQPQSIRLFHQEAAMLERLGDHDQIPRLLASFEETNRFYLVQEFIDGIPLADELDGPDGQKRRKTEAEVISLLQDVLTVLAFVHGCKVVHRDIKPANLMRRQRDGKMMLIDFGAVKALTQAQISAKGRITTTVSINTPGYSPIEQVFQGNPRLASDVYALGMTAIEALTGVYPAEFEREPRTAEVVWRPYCRVSPELANLLTQMVRHHFSRRFQDAGAALTALESFTGVGQGSLWTKGAKTVVMTPPCPPAIVPAKPRRDVLKLVGFSAVGGLLTLGGQQVLQRLGTGQRSSSSGGLSPGSEGSDGTIPLSVVQVADAPDPAMLTGEPLQALEFTTVQVNPQGTIISRPTVRARYFDEPYLLGKLGDALPLRMVQIPAGDFTMGSPEGEADRDEDEGPQRSVTVPSFLMGAFAITQRQYQVIMGENPSFFTNKGANRPVEQVSWLQATAFCEKLSTLTGRIYRLPSGVEWEYACRAGTMTPFYFGETLTTEIANYNGSYTYGSGPTGRYRKETVAVDSFFSNAFGLYNMHGNVREWCADGYHDIYRSALNNANISLLNDNNVRKLLRGGSWVISPRHCRSTDRLWDVRTNSYYYVGFRVVSVLSV